MKEKKASAAVAIFLEAMQLKLFIVPVKNLSVLTNEQLAQMVRRKVSTKAGLEEIEGVGDARIEKYGEAVLNRMVFNPIPG